MFFAGKTDVGLFLFLAFFPGVVPLLAQAVNADAQRVLRIIEKIEQEGSRGPEGASRKESVSETELNAYIAYRIASENGEIMKELRLRLLPRNRVEGKIFIDLSGRRVPGFLKPQMNIYFAGTLETEGSKIRIRFESLFLEEQRIQTAFLDLIIYAVSQFEKTEPVSIEDWYDLPFGILKMETRAGELVVSY
jgi:hypothetical protein